MWSLLKSLCCAAILLGVIGDIDCFATVATDDCCATEQCSLCMHSVVCTEVSPLVPVSLSAGSLLPAVDPQPATPCLARLTPPPRLLI